MNQFSTTTIEELLEDANQLELLNDRLTKVEASIIIDCVIDELKSLYKRRYLKAWEKNHSISSEEFDKKIAQLNNLKAEKKSALMDVASESGELELSAIVNLQKIAS